MVGEDCAIAGEAIAAAVALATPALLMNFRRVMRAMLAFLLSGEPASCWARAERLGAPLCVSLHPGPSPRPDRLLAPFSPLRRDSRWSHRYAHELDGGSWAAAIRRPGPGCPGGACCTGHHRPYLRGGLAATGGRD